MEFSLGKFFLNSVSRPRRLGGCREGPGSKIRRGEFKCRQPDKIFILLLLIL